MLIEKVKNDNLHALKEKDQVKRDVLTVVIGKYMNVCIEKKSKGQDATDADMLSVIQKTIKELNDSRVGYHTVNNEDKVKEIDTQISILNAYLPRQLTEDEVRDIITNNHLETVSDIMKFFKENYAGQVDMSMVSRVAREDK